MSKQRILIVEDHPVLLNAVCGLLENDGYEVVGATNGNEALEAMAAKMPELILSDIMMPQMDGYELYQQIRENSQWTRIPFIFLTAKGEQEDIKKGKALGVEDYLTKPFDAEEILVAVHARLARAADIQAATEQEFEETKQQIINVLSHELRTPLTYIAGYTELALEDAAALSPADMLTFLGGIKLGADRLQKLVEDLLIGVRIDVGQCEKEFNRFAVVRDDLRTLLTSCARHCISMAAERNVALEIEIVSEFPPVLIYEEFFIDALLRLIDNAIKFSYQGSKPVWVRAYADQTTVFVEIQDQGIGIAKENLPQIFRRLHQIDRQRIEQQGSGMGLFIAGAFIQLHGGQITVESELGKGSTFTISLPVAVES
ncbi:MAG TPA: hybrid sensor histidine kinase/response regulator [Thermoflexia bacterium]|nr:hybrid sensor histidine kinase/response regulator [Thermoflexia bacterium]